MRIDAGCGVSAVWGRDHGECRGRSISRGDAGFWGIDSDSIETPSAPFAHVRDASMRISTAYQRTRMRRSTAPLRQHFARCIEPDTGERQAKSQRERKRGRGFHAQKFLPADFPRTKPRGTRRKKLVMDFPRLRLRKILRQRNSDLFAFFAFFA